MEEIVKAEVCVHGRVAGIFEELEKKKRYEFIYSELYDGPPVSLTMPISKKRFVFDSFPPFFDGLLPEGIQLEGLLSQGKLDRDDYFNQLIAVGGDVVGAITVRAVK